MSGIEDKKNQKRIRLLEEAYKLFVEKSVNSTAVDDVVKAAGVAKGTFYLYFHDKYDLLNEIVVHKSVDAIIQTCDKVAQLNEENPLDFADGVLRFIDLLIDYMKSHREVLALVNKNLSVSFKTFTSRTDDAYIKAVGRVLGKFEKNGYSEDEAKMMVYLLVDMVGSVCSDAILTGRPYTIDEIKPMLFSAVRGILESRNKKTKEEDTND